MTPRGFSAKGVSPTRKATDFFFTKRSNSIKIRATYDTGVPIQASNSCEFLAEAESFGNFIPDQEIRICDSVSRWQMAFC